MNQRWYSFDAATPSRQGLHTAERPPLAGRPLLSAQRWIQPDRLDPLHRSFRAWGDHYLSPGPVTPERIWIEPTGTVAFGFARGKCPAAQSAVGAHAGLAAWLVLLSTFVQTEILLLSARKGWSNNDLLGALAFTTPALLPRSIVRLAPHNWIQVAQALADTVTGTPHAQSTT